MNRSVSVVIPIWNGKEHLERLLDSLDRQQLKPDVIFAIDNASTDGAAELAEARGAQVIRMGSNTGFAAAANRGIEESGTAWIALLNSDVQLEPDWLFLLVAEAERSKSAFACGKILNSQAPDLLDGCFDAIARSGCAWRVGSGRRADAFSVPRNRIAFASGTATLFHSQLFDEIGLFDIRFESYLEDVDLGLRAAAAGLTGVYVDSAVCHHHGSASAGVWSQLVVERMARNQLWLVAKHYSHDAVSANWWQVVVGQGLWGLLALRHGRIVAWLKGKVQAIAGWTEMRAATANIQQILDDGEHQIRAFQRQSGFDSYWKWYFRLAGRGAD